MPLDGTRAHSTKCKSVKSKKNPLIADYELVRLQEDITLAGFTPLMYNTPEPIFCHRDEDIETAQVIFFLCFKFFNV